MGIRTWNGAGTDKEPFDRIKCELSNRNWCSLQCTAVIEEIPQLELAIFPNPAIDFLTIDTKGEIKHVGILTIDGKTVQTNDNPTNNIDVRYLANGRYIIQVKTTNGLYYSVFKKF